MPADEWVFLTDEVSGAGYYANVRTRETRWDPPEELVDAQSGDEPYTKLANGWFKYVDDSSGESYYYNKLTQETQWTMPAGALPAGGAELGRRSMDPGYDESDDDVAPPPLPTDAAARAAEDDIDAPEENVFVRRLSFSGGGAAASAAPEEDEAQKLREKAEKRAARRLKILEEVLASERTYVKALQTLEKVYMVPLRMVADQPKGAIFKHEDLDAVFLNMDVIVKVNSDFLEQLEADDSNYGQVLTQFAKKFRGCYTRYVNNYDSAEAHLNKLKKSDKEKHRYLEVCKSHPDAGGLDVRSFLIQPVQRVPRYRMLLEDLLAHTDAGHADEGPLKEALEKVREVAMHINEEKRNIEQVEKLRGLMPRFTTKDANAMEKDLVRYDRTFLREGELVKVRLAHKQRRTLFLFNDLLIYAMGSTKGFVLKGKIALDNGARVELLPDTEHLQNAFALVDQAGKGYTWVGDSKEHTLEWFEAITAAIRGNRPCRQSAMAGNVLADVKPKTPMQRFETVKAGTTLMKYNQRDGKSGARWVKVSADQTKICWGDVRNKETRSDMKLGDAVALLHGAKSSAFFKQQGAKKDQDWLCFSVVFKGRTLDFAATNAEALLDWYLALAGLIPNSSEPLLDEAALRTRIEGML